MSRSLDPRMSLFALVLWIMSAGLAPSSAKADAHKDLVGDFENRVNQYLAVKKQASGSPHGQTTSAAKLQDSREQNRAKLQAARSAVKQGDIFSPRIAAYFRRQIGHALRGHQGSRVKASLVHAEPINGIVLKVNEPYPDGVALQSMPPTLLLKLPRLPQELQYRIVGRSLVLLDVEPNLVVDVLPDAIPAT